MRHTPPLNPFSVQCHGPGNIEYLFVQPGGLVRLTERLARHGWRGELCGRHGVGKSTLLRTLQGEAQRRGLRTAWWQCSDRQRWLGLRWIAALGRLDVVFLDGGERLVGWQLRWLMAATRAAGVGLVMTTHKRQRHGLHVPMRAEAGRLALVVARLLESSDHDRCRALATEALDRAQGNAREALFSLYHDAERGLLKRDVETPLSENNR